MLQITLCLLLLPLLPLTTTSLSPRSAHATFQALSANAILSRTRRAADRPGSPTTTNTCNSVREVPDTLRSPDQMAPNGLTDFYQKYTEAYGVPVVSSTKVPDDALKRACYVLRFMLADHSGVREWFYKKHGRVGVMGTTEFTTDIPEHSWLEPEFWNERARGLGATEAWPISTGAEENILCYPNDRYYNEDIFLHEFAHGVDLLGAKFAIPDWEENLNKWYTDRNTGGTLWANTYAMSTVQEYFAEGVQSWFNVNAYANPANGVHNHVATKEVLKTYDVELYDLIKQVFSCENEFIKRCEKSRSKEVSQRLLMNCNEGEGTREDEFEDDDDDETDKIDDGSKDNGYSTGILQRSSVLMIFILSMITFLV